MNKPIAQKSLRRAALGLVALLGLSACASRTPVPDWHLQAHGAVLQATQATLVGSERLAHFHWQRALDQARRTAQVDPMARVALIRCAVEHAAQLQSTCADFAALASQASPDDLAYARYVSGQLRPVDVSRLAPVHQVVSRLLVQGVSDSLASRLAAGHDDESAPLVAALQAVPEPLTQLVAASAALQHRQAGLGVVAVAVQAASEQGWQGALASWLTLQQAMAAQRGDTELADLAQRRLALLNAAASERLPPASGSTSPIPLTR